MKRHIPLAICCLCFLGGCGPREIGQGTSTARADSGPSIAENMRLPMTGASRAEHMLYYYNRPDVIQQIQTWRWNEANRLDPPDQLDAPAKPRQPGPFRQ